MSHTHRAVSISIIGKADQVLITCDCGNEEVIGLWYISPIKGWSKKQWKPLMEAVRCFLNSWDPTFI